MKQVVIKSMFGLLKLVFDDQELVKVTQTSYHEPSDTVDQNILRPITQCIDGIRDGFGIPIRFQGSPFQVKVWEAINSIPRGNIISYSELAKKVGNPGAARTVATACGLNPCVIVVPCHRVIRLDGGLGGFAWGIPIKRSLLARERVQLESARAPVLF